MFGKNYNSLKINTTQKKVMNTISTKFTPVKILNFRKSENNFSKKFSNTCQNFYKGKKTFNFTLNSLSNSKNKEKITNEKIFHNLKNKTLQIKKRIESPSKSIKKQVHKISLLSPIKNHIRYNTDRIKYKYSEKNNISTSHLEIKGITFSINFSEITLTNLINEVINRKGNINNECQIIKKMDLNTTIILNKYRFERNEYKDKIDLDLFNNFSEFNQNNKFIINIQNAYFNVSNLFIKNLLSLIKKINNSHIFFISLFCIKLFKLIILLYK